MRGLVGLAMAAALGIVSGRFPYEDPPIAGSSRRAPERFDPPHDPTPTTDSTPESKRARRRRVAREDREIARILDIEIDPKEDT